jgi:hypothetical protein
MSITRRSFIGSSTAAAALFVSGVARAAYLNLPLGLQLYSVRDLLPKDYAGTLKQIAALGYKEVEAAGCHEVRRLALRQLALFAGLAQAIP